MALSLLAYRIYASRSHLLRYPRWVLAKHARKSTSGARLPQLCPEPIAKLNASNLQPSRARTSSAFWLASGCCDLSATSPSQMNRTSQKGSVVLGELRRPVFEESGLETPILVKMLCCLAENRESWCC